MVWSGGGNEGEFDGECGVRDVLVQRAGQRILIDGIFWAAAVEVLAPDSDAVRLSLPSTKMGIDGLLLTIGETIEAVKVPVEAELCGRDIAYLRRYSRD